MNPMPVVSMQRATCSGARSIFAPSASSTSALPHCDDIARFPCFATRAPAPAATNAAHVLTLNDPLASPPVPHVSSSGPSTSTRAACSRITAPMPAISSTVSPFIRSAVANAANCAGVAAPDISSCMQAAASVSLRSARSTSFAIALRMLVSLVMHRRQLISHVNARSSRGSFAGSHAPPASGSTPDETARPRPPASCAARP